MLSLPEKILLTLAELGDLAGNIPTKKDWYHLNALNFEKPKKRTYTETLRRLLETAEIEKKVANGKVFFRVTTLGFGKIKKTFHLDRLKPKKWNGIWRQVIFDIEEKHKKDRDTVRRKLKDLGFGMLQESVWISPFPIERELEEFFKKMGVRGEILILAATIYSGDEKELAKRTFKLDTINDGYEELIFGWEEIDEIRDKTEKDKKIKSWEEKYFEHLSRDPFLPKELLPDPWLGDEVREIYLKKTRKSFWKELFSK